jgi:4'-phosphopantetheinyl transferase
MSATIATLAPPKRGEVHLWRHTLSDPCPAENAYAWLSDDERAKADRYLMPTKRDAFTCTRGLLRRILGGYLGLAPSEVPIITTSQGKPLLGPASERLAFSVSHRADQALLAVSCHDSLGVDLECCDDSLNPVALASIALSPNERWRFDSFEDNDKLTFLLRRWTAKEAYLKALGEGLSRPLPTLELKFPVEPPRCDDAESLPHIAWASIADDPSWCIASWSPEPGWFAALAAPRDDAPLIISTRSVAVLAE